jgi:PAS domain S-box-containing protein
MPTTSLWVWEREIDMLKSASVSGNDERKTKAQLSAELQALRQRVIELEAAEVARQQTDAACQQTDAARQQLEAERQRLHAALQTSETRYRRLFETAQDGILLLDAATGQITDVNPFLEKLLGYSHIELIGQHLWEIGPFKDVAESKLAFEQLQTNNYIRYDDLPLATQDGRRIQVEFVSNVYRVNGTRVIQCNVRDITVRHQADAALRASEERYRSLMEQASDGIFVADAHGKYLDVNTAGCALLGYTREEILQRSMRDLVNADELAAMPFKLADMQAGQAVLNERHMRRKDGSLVPVEISGRLLPDGWLLGMVRDITERKAAGQEIENLARFPAENPNPVLRMGSDGTLLYANEASHAVLQAWGCAVGERVPAFWQAVIAAAIAKQSNEHLDVQLADRVWSFFMTPVGEMGYVNLYGRDITDRQQAEEALRESEDRFKYVFDHSPIGKSITLPSGEIQVNEAFCEMLDYSPAELQHKTWQAITHPDDVDHTQREVEALLRGDKEAAHFIKRYLHRNGSVVWADVRTSLRRDQAGYPLYFMTTVLDITERKQAESQREAALDALRDSEQSLQDFINNSPDTIYVLDLQTHTSRFLNRTEFLGYSQPELETENSIMFALHPDDIPVVVNQWKQLTTSREDRIATVQYRVQNKQGVWEWIQQRTTILARAENGTPQKLLVTLSIITERKQAEDEVLRLNAELEQRVQVRTAQLEGANQELEAFSYSISHDLRAPLRAMDGFSRILEEDYGPQLDAEARRYLQIVRDNAQQMGHLIDDLLTFSRLSRQPLNKQPVEMNPLVQQVLADLQRAEPTRSVELVVGELPPGQADPALLKQVWINLLSNAFKFTGKREAARIEIGRQEADDQPIYFVRDNGAGFDMQYADKLFTVFQRFHRAEDYEGTGVGLAIVKRIVDRHGGRVWAEAEVDRGATFYFTL